MLLRIEEDDVVLLLNFTICVLHGSRESQALLKSSTIKSVFILKKKETTVA